MTLIDNWRPTEGAGALPDTGGVPSAAGNVAIAERGGFNSSGNEDVSRRHIKEIT